MNIQQTKLIVVLFTFFISLSFKAKCQNAVMPTGPTFVCESSFASIKAYDINLPDDHLIAYILIDNTAGVIVDDNIYGYSENGIFWINNAEQNVPYYLFAVMGIDDDGDQLPDLEDTNTAISSSFTEVIFIDENTSMLDQNFCNSDTTSNTTPIEDCDNQNDAGTMSDSLTELCFGDFATATATNMQIQPDATLLYILHNSSSSDSIGNVIAINETGIFFNDGELLNNQMLFISAYVGPVDENAMPMLDNPCADIALPGKAFQFFEDVELVITNQIVDPTTNLVELTFYLSGGYPGFPGNIFGEYLLVGDFVDVIDEPFEEVTIILGDTEIFEIEVVNACTKEFNIDLSVNEDDNVWPGDVNKNGKVNNKDVALIGLYLQQGGPERTINHQNTDWYAHPANNWNVQQPNFIDKKHADVNGDGIINVQDAALINLNYGNVHEEVQAQDTVQVTDNLGYEILLQPVGTIMNDSLLIDIVLQSTTGDALNIKSAYFTIDLSDASIASYQAELNFNSTSWLGEIGTDVYTNTQYLMSDDIIEVAFFKSDMTDCVGSGIIGQLILISNDVNIPDQILIQTKKTFAYQINGDIIGFDEHTLHLNLNSDDDCNGHLTINKNTSFQNEYKSSGTISTLGSLTVGEQQQVTYRANRIRMNMGFKVKRGANFHSGYTACLQDGIMNEVKD